MEPVLVWMPLDCCLVVIERKKQGLCLRLGTVLISSVFFPFDALSDGLCLVFLRTSNYLFVLLYFFTLIGFNIIN